MARGSVKRQRGQRGQRISDEMRIDFNQFKTHGIAVNDFKTFASRITCGQDPNQWHQVNEMVRSVDRVRFGNRTPQQIIGFLGEKRREFRQRGIPERTAIHFDIEVIERCLRSEKYRDNPRDSLTLKTRLGNRYAQLGHHTHALKLLNDVFREDPDNRDISDRNLLQAIEKSEKSIAEKNARSKNQEKPGTEQRQAFQKASDGETRDGEARVIQLTLGHISADGLIQLAADIVTRKRQQGNVQGGLYEGLNFLTRALTYHPNHPDILFHIGEKHRGLRQYRRAKQYFADALNHTPKGRAHKKRRQTLWRKISFCDQRIAARNDGPITAVRYG